MIHTPVWIIPAPLVWSFDDGHVHNKDPLHSIHLYWSLAEFVPGKEHSLARVKGRHYSQLACDQIIPAREAYASSVCCHYALTKPHKGPAILWRSLNSSPLRLIGYYLHEPVFYIRAFDCITTPLIFRGNAGGHWALSGLTLGSQEPELQCGTWQWMGPNDLDDICYTARRKPISPGNLAVEKKQRFKNKPHLFQMGVMLAHQCSTSLEFPCRMRNNYTQMTTQQLWIQGIMRQPV